jgi:hypothetical protein
MGEYYKILSEDKPALGMSFAFISNLEMDPLKNMQGQILAGACLGINLKQALDLLKRLKITPGIA